MKKYLTEFIGTFFLVMIVGVTVIKVEGRAMAPFAIGAVLMVMIFAGGHISGAHYNPAVTISVWLRGRCATADVPGYLIAQLAAAAAAAYVALFLKGQPEVPPLEIQLLPALLAEFFGTFALTYVVLNTATAKGTSGNSFYGLAIGATVLSMAFAFGAMSGGAFNPAVAIGLALMHVTKAANLWILFIAEVAAAIVSASVFRFTNPDDK